CHRIVRAFQALQRSLLRALGRVRAAWQEAGELRRAAAARAVSEPVIEVGGDEAIVHRLEEEAPWIPMEATGVPPLSLSASLRSHFEGAARDSEADFDPIVHALTEAPAGGAERAAGGQARFDKALGAALVEVDAFFGQDEDAEGPVPPGEDEPSGSAAPKNKDEPAAQAASPQAPKIVALAPDEPVKPRSRASRPEEAGEFCLPSTELLDPPSGAPKSIDRTSMLEKANLLERTLADYGVVGRVEEIHPGPTVTTYEV